MFILPNIYFTKLYSTMIAIIISLPCFTQLLTQILKKYDQTSKRSNSGSRRALEELKKENHQNLMTKMIGKSIQVQ